MIRSMGADASLQAATRQWIDRAAIHEYTYHFEALGRPIIQLPQDIVALSEIIWSVRPDLVIETGIARGGSLINTASQLALLDLCDAIEGGTVFDPRSPARSVVGIDIDLRPHNRIEIEAHPLSSWISMIEGSSTDEAVVERVAAMSQNANAVLVLLDSNHTHAHVLAELEAYAPLVTKGSYCIVYDTVIQHMAEGAFPDRPWSLDDNPMTAVHAYLRAHPEFSIDTAVSDKLQITVAPDGYLKRTQS